MIRPLPPQVADKFGRLFPAGDQWKALCPSHNDAKASLAIRAMDDGRVLFSCFAGETRVITRAGVRPIAELAGGEHELLVPSTSGAVWQMAPVRSFGVQPLMKLTLGRFSARKVIYATPEHRWFVQRRKSAPTVEVTTANLQPGARLRSILPRTHRHRVASPFGVAHGFTFGDGHIHTETDRCLVDFHGEKQALLPYFPMRTPWAISDTCLRLDGLPKFFKKLPSIDENDAYLYGFLAGYFAADGSIEGASGPPCLSSAREEDLWAIRDIATKVGLVTYPVTSRTRSVPLPQSRTVEATLSKVSFRAKSLEADFFLHPQHAARWEQRRTGHSQEAWTVVSVEETDRVEEVFCATVEGSGAFALEDFILTGNCHAGCQTEDIIKAAGLSWKDVMPEDTDKPAPEEWTPIKDHKGKSIQPSATYKYVDEKGTLLFEVCRFYDAHGKKDFRQRHPDPSKAQGWAWNMKGVRRVIYRLPEVLAAIDRGETIAIVEGEKDVHTAEKLGLVATTSPMGAGKFTPDMADIFCDGASVVIIADADDSGREHARKIRALIKAVGGVARLAECAGGNKDLTDHVAAGYGIDDIVYIDDEEMPDYGLIWVEDLIAGDTEEYDWLVPGLLEKGERFMLTGMEGSGKDLELSTKIPTPSGWTTMGELSTGDVVIDRDGKPCRVERVSDITMKEAHRVTFSDGSTLIASSTHQWLTQTWHEREYAKGNTKRDAKRAARIAAGLPAIAPRGKDQSHLRAPTEGVRTTQDIMDTLIAREGTKNPVTNHSIAAVKPIDLLDTDLPIDPYLLGVWLGDGSTGDGTIAASVRDGDAIIAGIEAGGGVIRRRRPQWKGDVRTGCDIVSVEGFRTALRINGLLGHKRVPEAYLRASVAQRLALLQGLMDTDGFATEPKDTGRRGAQDGVYELTVACPNEREAEKSEFVGQVMELLYSLGILPRLVTGRATIAKRDVGPKWRIAFRTDLPVFTVPWKAERMRAPKTDRSRLRYITKIENTGVLVPMRCIQVDSPTRTYLAGEGMIPTHNSVWLRQFATCVAAGIHPFTGDGIEARRVLWMDAENSKRQNARRFAPLVAMTSELHRPVPGGSFGFFIRPEGLDLTREADTAWFHERIAVMRPELLIIGPWYRLFLGSPNDEENQRTVISELDKARAKYGFAVMIETHSPHSDGMRGNRMGGIRPVRPLGSSILLRWPEYGYGLSFRNQDDDSDGLGRNGLPDFSYADFVAWRGARDEREWPQAFRRSNDERRWPWVECEPMGFSKHGDLKDEINENNHKKKAGHFRPDNAYEREPF